MHAYTHLLLQERQLLPLHHRLLQVIRLPQHTSQPVTTTEDTSILTPWHTPAATTTTPCSSSSAGAGLPLAPA
jgi:hypothetical protein